MTKQITATASLADVIAAAPPKRQRKQTAAEAALAAVAALTKQLAETRELIATMAAPAATRARRQEADEPFDGAEERPVADRGHRDSPGIDGQERVYSDEQPPAQAQPATTGRGPDTNVCWYTVDAAGVKTRHQLGEGWVNTQADGQWSNITLRLRRLPTKSLMRKGISGQLEPVFEIVLFPRVRSDA
jgi:hypothetical protein